MTREYREHATEQLILNGLEGLPKRKGSDVRRRGGLSLRQFQAWSRLQAVAVRRRSSHLADEELVLAQAIKVGEELGELHAEILGRANLQRRSKGVVYNKSSLAGELADLVISASVLSEIVGVDLPSAIEDKMKVVEERQSRQAQLRAV